MRKQLFLLLLFVSTLAPFASTPAARASESSNPFSEFEERRRNVATLMEAATVWVVGQDGNRLFQGSGFVVGAGLVATNAHVVDKLGKNGSVHVLNEDFSPIKAQIVAVDSKGGHDFALLRFTPPGNVALPVLTFNLDARRMDRVSAWGYPAMITQFDSRSDKFLEEGVTRNLKAPPVVYSEGVVNSIVSGKAGDAIIHSAQIASGNSGGPLVNSRGEVVGINTWGYTEEDEGAFVNAALLANDLAAFLVAQGVQPKIVAGQRIEARSRLPATEGRRGSPGRADPKDRIRDVGSFTVRVPLGWSVLDEEEDSILLGADDDSAVVAILIDDLDGEDLRRVARNYANELDGTRPTTDDGGESYTFTFEDDDVEFIAIVIDLEDDRYALILIGGDVDDPGVEEILDSLDMD